jgi:hypothetical protein
MEGGSFETAIVVFYILWKAFAMSDSERLDELEEQVQQLTTAVMSLERFIYNLARHNCPCPACQARRAAAKFPAPL